MHSELEAAAQALRIDLPNLRRAAATTEKKLRQAKSAVEDALSVKLGRPHDWHNASMDIVVLGSMARDEMSPRSDFDYLIVAYEMVEDPEVIHQFRRAAESARLKIGAAKPGKAGGFGGLVSASDLVDLIGLEKDTNRNHTNRILLLEESRPLLSDRRHYDLVRAVLERYLYDYAGDPKPRVPRFLVNDVLRYWSTVAVDYQAKRWVEMEGEKWGMRYLKLLTSRKLGFAGSLVSLFIPQITGKVTDWELLRDQFSMPALARLAQLHRYVEKRATRDDLKEILLLADRFVGDFARAPFRDAVNKVVEPRVARKGSVFYKAREAAEALHHHIAALFLSEDPLKDAPVGPDGAPTTLRSLTASYLLF